MEGSQMHMAAQVTRGGVHDATDWGLLRESRWAAQA